MSALDTNIAAAMAFNRFGLGARPNDEVPPSPTAWLLAQLDGPDPYQPTGAMTTADCLAVFMAARKLGNETVTDLFESELDAVLGNALVTDVPFRERLVWFWANHFSLLTEELGVSACAGAFVREAIRPYVNGTFTQMLLAVMQHPAMLMSLNNNNSAGPDSQAGLRCQVTGCLTQGINENLGRECMELHTIGVNGGYTQADVDSLSMLLSGWTVNLKTQPYGFQFNPSMHEPGNQTFMGNSYTGDQPGALAAVTWLSNHPMTYLHLATELVAHFTSDTPDPADVTIVANALTSSGGNLAAAAAAVVGLSNSWVPYTKFRSPFDYVIGAMRGLGYTMAGSGSAFIPRAAASAMGQDLWQPPLPNGYSDSAADWTGSAQVLLRSDYAAVFCKNTLLDPFAIAASALGPLVRPATISVMNTLSAPRDQMAMLILSPEFQRR